MRNCPVKPRGDEHAPLDGGRQGGDADGRAVAAVLAVLACGLLGSGLPACLLLACVLLACLLSALWPRMLHCTIRSGYTVERPNRQVTRDGKPGNRALCRDFDCRQFAVFEVLEDLPTGRVDEDCENVDDFRGRCVRRLVAVVCRHGEQCVEDRLSRAG